MASDWRGDVVEFYDLAPHHPDDVPFYIDQLPGPSSSVLELGCGTGRVTVPLAHRAGFVRGLDNSPAMIEVCRRKLAAAGVPGSKAEISFGDITDFSLGQKYDLIIAPFRVLQNLATDAELEGLFSGIRAHLDEQGTCILNAFQPRSDRETLIRDWVSELEQLAWEVEDGDTSVQCFDWRRRLQERPLVLFPELIYRRVRGTEVLAEASLQIAMRCFYPQDLLELVERHGFEVVGKWGGYAGERYGEGSELVVAFQGV